MGDQEKIPSLEVRSESLGAVKELIKNRNAEADCEKNYKLESVKKKPSNDRNKPPELVPFCVDIDDCNRNEDSDSPPHLFPEGILTRTKLNKTLPGGKSNIPIIDISSSHSKQSVEVECIDVEDSCKNGCIKNAKPNDKKTDHSSVVGLFKGGEIFNNYKEHKRGKNISVINLPNRGKTKLKERDKLKKASERMMSPPRALINDLLNLNDKCTTVHSPAKQQINKDTPFYMIMNDNNFTVTPCSNTTLAGEHFKSQITNRVSSNMRGSTSSGLELSHSNEKDDEVMKDAVEILKSSTECDVTFDTKILTTKLENNVHTSSINSKSTDPFHARGKEVQRNVSRISESLISARKQSSVLSAILASRDITFTYTPSSSGFFSRQLIDNASSEGSSLVVKELQGKMKSEQTLELGSCPKSLSVSATSIKECNMPNLVKSKDKCEISKGAVVSNRVIRLTFPECMTVTDSQRKKVAAISFIPKDEEEEEEKEEEDEVDHYLQRKLQNSSSINISPIMSDGQVQQRDSLKKEQIVEIDQRNISKNNFSRPTLKTPVDTQAVSESCSDSNNDVKLEDKKCLEVNPALLKIKHKENVKTKQNPNLEKYNEQIQSYENYEGLSPSLEAGSSSASCLQDIKIQNITSLNSDYSLKSDENYQDTKDKKNTLVNCKNLLVKRGDKEKTLRVNTIKDSDLNCAVWPEIEDEYDDDEYFTVPQCVSTGKEERDVIDGVEFLSFESERDMVEFTKIQQDFWHGTSLDDGMIQSDDGLDMMDDAYAVSGDIDLHSAHQAIIPTKTNDITKIKGWRNKQFAVNDNPGSYCGFSTGSYEDDDGFESCDIKIADETNMDEDQQNHWYSEDTYNNDVVGTRKDDASELKEDQNNKLSLCLGKSSLLNEDAMLTSKTVFKPEAIELLKRLGSSTHESDIKDTKNTKNSKSAFVSDILDSYLSSHSQLNVSYEIPKLGAEEGISYQQDLEVNNFSPPTPPKPLTVTTTSPEKQMKSKIGPKPKTLAEKRKLMELMDQDFSHQRKRSRGRPKLHSSVEPSSPLGKSTKLIEDSNKPRSLKISYPDASFLQQSNTFNLDPDYKYTWIGGRPIRITGSKICREPISIKFNTSPKKNQKISTPVEDQKPSNPQSLHLSSSVPEACNKSSNNSNVVEKEAKIKLMSNSELCDEKDKRQEKEMLAITPGNPGDETPSIEHNSNNETKVSAKRKTYGIVVSPCVGLPLHPLALKHLKILRHDQYVIDSIWAQFAVSVVITEMNSIKNQIPEKHVIPICSSLTLKNQNVETKCICEDAGPNFSSSQSSLQDGLQINLIFEDSHDPIQVEVKQILGDMVDCVVNHEIEDAIIQNDPDSQSVAPLKNPKSPKKIRQKKDKVFRELNRLDVNVIVMGEDGSGYIKDVRGDHHCEREFCRLGCICSSLQNSEPQSTFTDHCGKAECMFECSCKVKESEGYKYSEKPSLFYSTAMRLQDEGNRHLAKVEKEFRHTVIQSKNKMIVVGGGSSGDGGRRRREIKLPERYRDSSVVLGKEFAIAEFKMIASDDTNNNISSSSISHSRRSERQLNLPNYVQIGLTKSPPKITNKTAKGKLSLKQKISLWRERYKAKPCKVNVERMTGLDGVVPWCMIHLKYDCFCSGQSVKPFKKMPYRPLERPPPVPGPILESEIKKEKTTKQQRPISRNVAVKSTTLSLNMHCHDTNRHSARTYGATINYALRNQAQFYKYHIQRFLEESQKIINADSIHNTLYFVNFIPVESGSTHVVVPPSDVGSFGVSDESQVIPYVEESNETEDVGFAKIVSITSLRPEEFERCETMNESVESDDNEDNRDNGDNAECVVGNVNTSCEMKGMPNGVTKNVSTETLDKHEDTDIDTLPIYINNVQETSSQNNSHSVEMFEVQCSNLVPILPDGDTDSHSIRLAELISMRESELKIIFRDKKLSLNLSCDVAGSLQIVNWETLLDQIRNSFCHVWLHYKRGCMPKLIITATCLKPDQYCIYFDPCKQEYKAGFQGKVPPSIFFLLDQLCHNPEPSVIADCLLLNANAFGILLSNGEYWELVGTFLNDSERSKMDDIKITNTESVDSTKTLDEKVPEILKNTPELLSSMKEQETQNNREVQVVKDTTKQDTSCETLENPRKILSENDICIIEKTDSEHSEMNDIKITNTESVDSTKTLDEKVPEILKNTPELLSSMKEQETQNNREVQVVKDTTKQDTACETENSRKVSSENDIYIIEKTDSEHSEMDDMKITNTESVDSTKTLDEKVPEILKNTPELLSSMKEQETQNNREVQVVKDTTKQDTSCETLENPSKILSKNDICIIEKTDIMQHSRKPSCVKSNWKDSDQDVGTFDLSEPSPDTSVLCELTGVLKSEKSMEKCDVRDSTCDVEICVLNDDGKVIFSSLSMEIAKTGNGLCSDAEKAVQLESTKSSTINKVPLTEEAIKIKTESSDTSKLLSTVEASENRKSDLSRSENVNNSKLASGNKEGSFKAISNKMEHSQTNSEPVLSRYTANGSSALQSHSKMNTSETVNFVKLHDITGVSELSSRPEIEVPLPTGSLPGRWFMLSVENQFDLLYIANNKSLIRYSQIIRAVTLANSHGKTVRLPLSSKKEAQAYGPNHPKFGVYAVPKLFTRVFIGPYGLREDAGVNALRVVNGKLINAMESKKSPHTPAFESGEKEHILNKRMEELYDKYAHFPDCNGSCHGMWLYTRRPHDYENKNSGKSSIVMPFPLPINIKNSNVRINMNTGDEKSHSYSKTGNEISLNIEEKSSEFEINTVPIKNETSSHDRKEMKQLLAMQEGGGQVAVQKVIEGQNDNSALIDKHMLSSAAAPDRLDSDGEMLDVETPCNTGELFRETHLRSQIETEENIDNGSTSETSITPETRSCAISGENPFAASQPRIKQSGRSLLKKPTPGEKSVGSTQLKTVRTLRPFSSNSNLVTLGKTVVAVKLVPSIPSVGYVEASMYHNKSILLKNPFTAEKEPTLFQSLNIATTWLTDRLKSLINFMPKDLILKWRIKHKSVNIKDCKPFDPSLFDGNSFLTVEGICQPLEAHAKYLCERMRRKELIDGFRELGSSFLTQEELNKTTKFRILKRALWEIEKIHRANKRLQKELTALKRKRVANFLRFCWTVRALPSVDDRKKALTSLIRTFENEKGGLPDLHIDDSTFEENSQEEKFKTPVDTLALLKAAHRAVGAEFEIKVLSDDDSVELEDSNDRRQAGDVKNISEIGDNEKLIMDVPLRKKDDAVSMSIISVVGEDKSSPAKEIKDEDSVSVIRLPQTSDKLKHLSQTPFVSDTSIKLDVTRAQNQQKNSIADLNISSCYEKGRDLVSARNSTSVLESVPSNSKGFLRISKVCTSIKQEDIDEEDAVMVDVTDTDNVQEKKSTGLCFSVSSKQRKRLSICVDSNQIWASKSTVVETATKPENTDGHVKQQLQDVLQGSDIDLRCSPAKIRVLHKKPVSELQGQNISVPTLITLSSDSIAKASSATMPSVSNSSVSKDIGFKCIVYDETEGKFKTVLNTSSVQTGGKVNYHVFKQDKDSTVLSKITSTSTSSSTTGTSRPIPLVPRQSTISESQLTPYTLLKGVHKSSQIVPAKSDVAGSKFLTVGKSDSFILCNGKPIYIHKPSQANFSSVVSSQQTSLDGVKAINSFPKSSTQSTLSTVAVSQKIKPSLLKNPRGTITFETVPVLAPSPFKVTSITKTIETSSNSQPKLLKQDIENRAKSSLLTQRSEAITRELASPHVDPENKSPKMTDIVSSPNYSVIKIDKSLLEKPTCTSLVEKHSSNSSNAFHALMKLPNSTKETTTTVPVSAPSGSSCDSAKSVKEASAATKDISAVCTEETQTSKINLTSLRSTKLKKEKCTSSSTSPPKCRRKKPSEMVKVISSKACQSKLRKKGLLKKQKAKTTSQVKQLYPTRMVTRSKIRKKYK